VDGKIALEAHFTLPETVGDERYAIAVVAPAVIFAIVSTASVSLGLGTQMTSLPG